MLTNGHDLAAMADALGKSPDYRVLRRLVPRTEFAPSDGQATKTGIMLDVETTGLDTARDEIIELAMIKFTYLPNDRIAQITDVFSSFNEPDTPIPAEITELTGLTDEMVLGHRIDPDAVTAFASDAVIIIAHNASFDRKFSEMRIWAEQSPFELKDELKRRGYRWSDGADGRLRSWYIDVDEAEQEPEIDFLRRTIYLRDVTPQIQTMTAINRFSNRA